MKNVPLEIGVEHRVLVLAGHLERGPIEGDTHAVDQYVELTETRDDFFHRPLDARERAQVEVDGLRA